MSYLKGYFIQDVICIIPFYLFDSETGKKLFLLRLLRFFRFFTIVNRFESLVHNIMRLMTHNISLVKSMTKILQFAFYMIILSNILCSMWFAIGKQDNGWLSSKN